MKKGILTILIAILIIEIGYFGLQMFDFPMEFKEDSYKNIGIEKDELSDYKNSKLILFYRDFENEITEIHWSDEPPAILSRVIFRIDEKKYIEIQLDSIPRKYKMNMEFNWKMEEVGNSTIRNIRLIEKY